MTPNVSFKLPTDLGQTMDRIPSNLLSEGQVFQDLRCQIISGHLKGEQGFLTNVFEVKVPFGLTLRKAASYFISDKMLWKKVAIVVRDLALITLTLIGSYFLFKEAKSQLDWIGNHKIIWHLNDDYKYFSVFSQSDYNRRFLPSALFLISVLSVNLFNLQQSVLGVFNHVKDRIQQLKRTNDYFEIRTKTTCCSETLLGELSNQKVTNPVESWQDPITLDFLSKKRVLSPATLIIGKMAFSLETAIIVLFFRDTDETEYPEFVPAESKLILKHPANRDVLDDAEQANVVQQICDTFLITSLDFSNCWKVQKPLVPQTDYPDVEKWYRSTQKLPEELTIALDRNPEDKDLKKQLEERVFKDIKGQYRAEYASFLASERGVYMQMMRFNNFCKLVPRKVAERMESKLTEGLAEKLSRIRLKENA